MGSANLCRPRPSRACHLCSITRGLTCLAAYNNALIVQGLQVPLDNEEEEEEEENPSSSAPIASPSVPKAGSILRHADGSGRQSDDVVEGAA